MKPRFIVKQKITAFVNKYAVYEADADGKEGNLIAFAQQKRLNIKEKILFYDSEHKNNLVFSLRAEKVIDVHGKYFVEDAGGNLVGSFSKDFSRSLTNSTWHIFDGEVEKIKVFESNNTVAIFRRFAGFIPIIGDLIEIMMVFFKYHFIFGNPQDETPHGKYTKTTLFRDHYLLNMDDEYFAGNDWRVLAAMCVALDALQSR